jgi:hypothetical protein
MASAPAKADFYWLLKLDLATVAWLNNFSSDRSRAIGHSGNQNVIRVIEGATYNSLFEKEISVVYIGQSTFSADLSPDGSLIVQKNIEGVCLWDVDVGKVSSLMRNERSLGVCYLFSTHIALSYSFARQDCQSMGPET